MDTFQRSDLTRLMSAQDFPCVSIYLPTHHAFQATQQDHVRLKTLLDQAERQLVERGLRASNAHALLEKPRMLLGETAFWQERGEGLAIFLSSDEMLTFQLPLAVDELAVVGRRFHVLPLLPLLSDDRRFFLLAVSQKHVRFYHGDRRGMQQRHVEAMPDNLAEILASHHTEGTRQQHTVAPSRRGKKAAAFHGQGDAADEIKEDLLIYFRHIDAALRRHSGSTEDPLVFAGVDYLFPIYRQANHFPHLLEQHVSGNPDLVSSSELHHKAWGVVAATTESAEHQLLVRHEELRPTVHWNNKLIEVLPLARQGQVASLRVAARAQRWGRFDPVREVVQLDTGPRPGNEELINLCVLAALAHKAELSALDVPCLPDGEVISAELRRGGPPPPPRAAPAVHPATLNREGEYHVRWPTM